MLMMVTLHTTKLNDQGVSEAIGFMLIFAIVIAGIGLVTLYGYPLLLQQQVGADEKIMEKNMIVLQNDIKSLAYKTVPFKETSLKIGGGSLTVYNSSYSPSSSTITIRGSGITYVSLFTPGELRYESVSAQTDISLQNGAVVMRPRINPGSVMLSEPRWFYDVNTITNTSTMVINLINITSNNILAKEGIGTVQMTLGETNYTYVPNINPVEIVYTPYPGLNGLDYSIAWDNYIRKTFTNQPGLTLTTLGTPGNTFPVTYTLTVTGSNSIILVIKKYEVQIKNI
jgi:hypothetical protein